jgi:hypothetical protein
MDRSPVRRFKNNGTAVISQAYVFQTISGANDNKAATSVPLVAPCTAEKRPQPLARRSGKELVIRPGLIRANKISFRKKVQNTCKLASLDELPTLYRNA